MCILGDVSKREENESLPPPPPNDPGFNWKIFKTNNVNNSFVHEELKSWINIERISLFITPATS